MGGGAIFKGISSLKFVNSHCVGVLHTYTIEYIHHNRCTLRGCMCSNIIASLIRPSNFNAKKAAAYLGFCLLGQRRIWFIAPFINCSRNDVN